jgi:hypothetical protein
MIATESFTASDPRSEHRRLGHNRTKMKTFASIAAEWMQFSGQMPDLLRKKAILVAKRISEQ